MLHFLCGTSSARKRHERERRRFHHGLRFRRSQRNLERDRERLRRSDDELSPLQTINPHCGSYTAALTGIYRLHMALDFSRLLFPTSFIQRRFLDNLNGPTF